MNILLTLYFSHVTDPHIALPNQEQSTPVVSTQPAVPVTMVVMGTSAQSLSFRYWCVISFVRTRRVTSSHIGIFYFSLRKVSQRRFITKCFISYEGRSSFVSPHGNGCVLRGGHTCVRQDQQSPDQREVLRARGGSSWRSLDQFKVEGSTVNSSQSA